MTRISDLVRALASGGTVDEAPRIDMVTRLRVQPESLRYVLVRDVFLSGAGSLEVRDAISQLDRPSNALLPLVGAVQRGADIERRFLVELLDLEDAEAVTAYALLGPEETLEALELTPLHRGSIARAAYEFGISQERTLNVLMDLAVGDQRAEHSFPDHPLRVIGDHLASTDQTIERRKLSVAVAGQWLRDGRDANVAFRVLAHAIQPGVRHVYSDPGLGNTVTIAEAALPAPLVQELSQVWDSVLEIVARERGASPAPLIETLHYWVYPSLLTHGQGNEDAEAAIRSEAERVIGRLVEILRDQPGALRRLAGYAARGRLDVQVDIPADFGVLFPEEWDGREDDDGHAGWERRADDAVHVLAVEMRGLPVDDITTRIADADSAAADAGITYPRLTPLLAQLLAAEIERPELMLVALEELSAAGDLLLPFLDRVVELRPDGWEAIVERLLEDDRTTWTTVQVALTRPIGPRLKDAAIRRMTPVFRNLIDMLIARDQIDLDTIERLLNAPDGIVARDVAVAIGHTPNGSLLTDLGEAAQARWRDVIIQSPADDFWYSVILKRDPTLFADWLRAWFARIGEGSSHESLPHTLQESICELPATLRAELIRAVPADVHSFYVQDIVTQLVAGDLDVAVVLLERGDLEDLHWTVLRDGPSEAWMERALKALDRGWEPTRIVAYTTFSESVWSGEESLHWQSKVDTFADLCRGDVVDAPRERIIAAGIEYFTERQATAAERERRERVFGYDRE